MITEHELAMEVASIKGNKQEVNINQVSEIVNIVLNILATKDMDEVSHLLNKNKDFASTKSQVVEGFDYAATGREGDGF